MTTSNSDLSHCEKNSNHPPVVSVLRKSGSFASLQVQKSNSDQSSPLGSRKTKVTVIHTDDLPNYSSERYYMLSEIQLKAHSIIFLRDLFPRLDGGGDDDNDDDTHDLSSAGSSIVVEDSISDDHTKDDSRIHRTHDENEERERYPAKVHSFTDTRHDTTDMPSQSLPFYVILYLLWRPDGLHPTPEAYAKQVVNVAIDQIFYLYRTQDKGDTDDDSLSCSSDPCIYLVVDRLVYRDGCNSQSASFRESEIEICEQLIGIIATDMDLNLRSIVQGVTVGLSNDFRAAPGLEICMDSILVGDAERRHYAQDKMRKRNTELTIIRNSRDVDPSRSCIGIVTEYPDDLTGCGPSSGETDAAQDLSLHTRSSGNWSGKGSYLNYAARAQQKWREMWNFHEWEVHDEFDLKNIGNEYSILRRRNKKKNSQESQQEEESSMMHYLPSRRLKQRTEQIADMMVIGFLSFVATMLWKQYDQEICNMVASIWNVFVRILDGFRQ